MGLPNANTLIRIVCFCHFFCRQNVTFESIIYMYFFTAFMSASSIVPSETITWWNCLWLSTVWKSESQVLFLAHFFLHLFFSCILLFVAPLGSSPRRDEFSSWRLCWFSQRFRFISRAVVRAGEKEDVGGGCLVSEEIEEETWGERKQKEFVKKVKQEKVQADVLKNSTSTVSLIF